MTTTNFQNGVTNVPESASLGSYVAPDPTKCHAWMDDFDRYTDATTTTTLADWLATLNGTAAVASLANEDGGILLLTTDTATANFVYLQWKGGRPAVTETWKFEVGKKLWLKTKFKVSVAAGPDALVGLQITDASPLDATDGVYFYKAAGSATLNLLVTKNSTSTTVAVGTMADDTYVTVAILYDGADGIDVFLNDVKVGRAAVTNLPDDEELAQSIAVKNNNATARTMRVDYLFVSKQRDAETA